MPRSPEGFTLPEQLQRPDALAKRFFVLLKERGDLRRSLRSASTIGEEEVNALREGKASSVLEMLRARREHASKAKPVERLSKRLDVDTEAKQRLGEIDAEIKNVLDAPGVREAVAKVRHERVEKSQTFKQVSDELDDLQAILDELSVQEYAILRGKAPTKLEREMLEGNAIVRAEVERRLRALKESGETTRMARIAELLSYQEQLQTDRYAMTPSRYALAQEIQTLWARSEAVLLTGPTGTGKTELFAHLTKKLYDRPLSRLVRCTQNTTPAEIFGKMGLKAAKDGATETVFQPGVYVQSIDEGMPCVFDEFNLLETKIRFGMKELYNRQVGDTVTIQEDSGLAHKIQEGFVFGATANIKSAKHKERFELDPAEARVFASRKVDYLPKEEVYDLILAKLIDRKGELRLSQEDASQTLKCLLEAVELTQQAFEGKQTQFYAEGAGAKKIVALLEKAVFDQGRVLKIISGWTVAEARGQSFREFLENELLHVIRTEDYPEKDRRLLLQIFVTKGFFNGQHSKEIGIPGVDEAKLTAWGWKFSDTPGAVAQVLTPSQVADLDPFSLRKIRAEASADEFLEADQADARKALVALHGLDLSKLPKEVRERLKENREFPIDLRELRTQWVTFYQSHGLTAILKDKQGLDTIPQEITLTPEQIEILKEKAKEGFTRITLVPRGIEAHLALLKEKLVDGLEKDSNGEPIEAFLNDYEDKKGVKSSFPTQIETTDPSRKDTPYLLLTNPDQPLHPGSKNKTANALLPEFEALGLSGLTLHDFFIEERFHLNQTQKHLVDWGHNDWTWLLSSRDAASRVLSAYWVPGRHQVEVGSSPSDGSSPDLGARSSVVLALES